MDYEGFKLERKDGIAIFTFNRPERLNAFTMKMIHEDMPKVISDIRDDDNIKVLIITGAGRGFCTGLDASELAVVSKGPWAVSTEVSGRRALIESPLAITELLVNLTKPTIAVINGIAIGGGLTFALACDIRIASERARFGSGFIKVGLIPEGGTCYLLSRLIGTARACEFALSGDMIDAKEAERIALVNRVVPHNEVMKITMDLAMKITKGPPVATELTKKALYRALDTSSFTAHLDFENHLANICRSMEDFKEGVMAFKEKREPIFRGL